MLNRLGRFWCWLWTGHHDIAAFEGRKWTLRCLYCGRQTIGWRIDESSLRPLTQSDIEQLKQDLFDSELKLHGGG